MMQTLEVLLSGMVVLPSNSGSAGSKVVTVSTKSRVRHSLKWDNQLVDLLTWISPMSTLTK